MSVSTQNSGENKRKHLEFIQNIITRMATNSFMVKGWTVTLVAAIFALSAKDANAWYILITLIVIPVFWGLDGFFLDTERSYRNLYDQVRLKNEEEIDYALRPVPDKGWFENAKSKTLQPFYGSLLVSVVVILAIILVYHCKG